VIPAEGTEHPGPGRDATEGMLFAAEMYGVQRDHLAAVLGVSEARARPAVARWRARRPRDGPKLTCKGLQPLPHGNPMAGRFPGCVYEALPHVPLGIATWP
jgi:hypothetical protein